jgi:hypothetical protein
VRRAAATLPGRRPDHALRGLHAGRRVRAVDGI